MLRPGDFLSERYRIVEHLGAGGMGTLWRAHHVELGVDVALKVVSTRATSASTLKRFRREARAAARLQSPNIVKVFDYGEFHGLPYLAMELLRGEDLAQRLARTGKLSPEACLAIMDGVIKAVQAAHEARIVHRDLKPGNIFLERAGYEEIVKILDFGVAKDLGAVNDPGTTREDGPVGSPAYMSPEQVWGQEIGPRADVWALGVITFEMLTGKNPFLADTLAKTFERIIREPLPIIRDFAPNLPATLGPFFERAFARAPADRLASAGEFGDALRRALNGELSSASGAERSRSGSRRGLALAGCGIVLVSSLIWLGAAQAPSAPHADAGVAKHVPTGAVPARNPASDLPTPTTMPAMSALPESPSSATQPSSRAASTGRARQRLPAPPATSSGVPREAPPVLDPRFGIPLGPER